MTQIQKKLLIGGCVVVVSLVAIAVVKPPFAKDLYRSVFKKPSSGSTTSDTPSTSQYDGTKFKSAGLRIDKLKKGDAIESPAKITGLAKGSWYFEGTFPIKLVDDNGKILATGVAKATSDWQVDDYVPYEVTLTFTKPESGGGALVFSKDNPSGLPENDLSVNFIITFK